MRALIAAVRGRLSWRWMLAAETCRAAPVHEPAETDGHATAVPASFAISHTRGDPELFSVRSFWGRGQAPTRSDGARRAPQHMRLPAKRRAPAIGQPDFTPSRREST